MTGQICIEYAYIINEDADRRTIMNKFFLKSRSVFFSWLLSYFLLMLLLILISTSVNIEAEKIIRNEVTEVNMEILKQVRQGFDNGLEDVWKFVSQVGLNPKLGRLMNLKQVPEGSDYYQVTQLENELKFYKAVNGFIDDFYVYFTNMDKILSIGGGLMDKELFYDYSRTYFKYFDGLSYEEWQKVIKGEFSGEYIPLGRHVAQGSSLTNPSFLHNLFPLPAVQRQTPPL